MGGCGHSQSPPADAVRSWLCSTSCVQAVGPRWSLVSIHTRSIYSALAAEEWKLCSSPRRKLKYIYDHYEARDALISLSLSLSFFHTLSPGYIKKLRYCEYLGRYVPVQHFMVIIIQHCEPKRSQKCRHSAASVKSNSLSRNGLQQTRIQLLCLDHLFIVIY